MSPGEHNPGAARGLRRGRIRIRIVTPAVIGGAEGRAGDSISPMRVPSLRGVWRWWFRAGLGSVLCPADSSSGAQAQTLKLMRSLEARVFGSTERASMLQIRPTRLVSGKGGPSELKLGRSPDTKGRNYLGYGLFDKGKPTRALAPGSEYEVSFRLRPDPDGLDAQLLATLRATLWAWSTFGGLGARSRRGWGSVELTDLELDGAPWTWRGGDTARPVDPNGLMNATVKGLQQTFADFSALVRAVNHSPFQGKPLVEMRTLAGLKRIVPLPTRHRQHDGAMEQAGVLLQRYRSSVERGRAGARPLPDYFEVKAAINRQPGAPRMVDRAAFGLPLPFYFRSLGGQKARFLPDTRGADRLASPLMVRVCALEQRGQRSYVAMFADLSERPAADPLLGQGVRMHNRPDVEVPSPDGRVISAFLDWAYAEAARPTPRRRGRR